ncbi:beta-lactamase superfamily domain-containing protein [Echria macrotheca]|uniref:Beta-lactamase superfamily domain-containing protein n=1 Tax=Echria macrotheca TaxID=438768 RepID=A0AAJ0BFG8_9PEZI|nr:beta-lactamase superfamily domain-containing protein [Echria macrotheca]
MTTTVYTSTVTKQSGLVNAPDDADRAPHHVRNHAGKTVRFQNPHPSAGEQMGILQMVRTMLGGRLSGELTNPDISGVKVPVVTPAFLPRDQSPPSLRATWLGHACYLVEFPSGLRVLFDPVFEDRCAPVQFVGPRRYSPPPCGLGDIPAVDAVVISHSHYDHLSHPTVTQLARAHPNAQFFVGLGLESWFRGSGIERVVEMDWWEDAELVLERQKKNHDGKLSDENDGNGGGPPDVISARISCLPSQHSSGRTGFNKDHTLWASWAVYSGGKSVWFGGDTGYRCTREKEPVVTGEDGVDRHDAPGYKSLPVCPDFADIGRLRGPFDLGLIPIAAYKPRKFFSWMHADPFDAVEIFRDTRCKRAMGIHWGTWVLTSEEPNEPPRLLREALKREGIAETGVFDVCAVGESREF